MKIILTHLNDLNSFYVQKLTLQNFLKNLNFYIEHERNGKLAWNDVRIRRTYGVLYETKKTSCWRRGRLMDIIYKDGNFLYKIFFIDYGNTNWVTIDKLKEIRHFLIRRSPFAVQCKLTNPNGIIYDANAHIQLAQIIGKCELHMQHVENGCGPARVKEVDLFIPTSKGTFVSVRKILFEIETTELKEVLLAYNAKLLKNTKKLEVGQEEQVIVTHVGDDPFKLYIQLASNIDILNKMKHDMKLFYENQNASCIPVEDSDAVIYYQHPNQGDWHRARIISVNNKSQHVDVFFVDWGGLGTVPWSSVKLLKEKFIKMECQAIAVKLAHIHQCSAEARDFLNEQLLSTEGNYKMIIASKEEAEIYLPIGLSLNDLIMQKYPHLVRFTNKVTLGQFENENNKDKYEEENDAQHVEHDNCMEDKKSKFENNDGPHLVIFTNKVTLGQFENANNKDEYEEENDAQHVEHDNCMEDKKSKFENNDGPHLVRFTNKVTLGQFENENSKDNYEEENDAQNVEHDNCMEDKKSKFEINDGPHLVRFTNKVTLGQFENANNKDEYEEENDAQHVEHDNCMEDKKSKFENNDGPHLVIFTNKVTLGQFENENSKDNYEEENDAQNVEHDNCMEDKKSKFENNDRPHLVRFTNKVTLGQFENENSKDNYEEENDAQNVEHDNCMEDKKSKFENNDRPHLVRFTNKVTLGQFENENSKDNYEEKNDAQHVEHDNCMEDENSEFENNDDVLSAYIYAPIPKSTHGKCKMSIVDVTKLNFKYNVVLNISNNEISTNSEDFKTLNNEIQKFVKNQPILKKIETNEPCICFNVKNKSWCRAVIYDNLGYGYASVMFVDYGNVETVNVENIKEMRPKWFNFPVYKRIATINIELEQINRFHHVLTYLINLRGKSVSVEIVSENPLKVHLYHGKKLCYQNLIDYGIVSAL